MKTKMTTLLRIGLGITFVWIGFLIWQGPELWAGFLPVWMSGILPITGKLFMQLIAVFDLSIGLLMLINKYVSYAALSAFVHLLILTFILGFNDIAARDLGLAFAALALFVGTKRS